MCSALPPMGTCPRPHRAGADTHVRLSAREGLFGYGAEMVTMRLLVLVPVMPHQAKHEQLAVVIPSDIAKPNCRAIEFEFTKECPLW